MKSDRDYKPRVCVENSATESVQFYTVRSKFHVTTFTCLDNLAVKVQSSFDSGDTGLIQDDCECITKSGCERPIHLVFVIDGSDSFNYDIMKDGKKESSWFEKIKHFLVDFIESANFDQRSVPTLLSGR